MLKSYQVRLKEFRKDSRLKYCQVMVLYFVNAQIFGSYHGIGPHDVQLDKFDFKGISWKGL